MRWIVTILIALLLAGCGDDEPQNRDPRIGRVWLDQNACDWDGCWGPWKVCVGPDLVFYPVSNPNGSKGKIVRKVPECERP